MAPRRLILSGFFGFFVFVILLFLIRPEPVARAVALFELRYLCGINASKMPGNIGAYRKLKKQEISNILVSNNSIVNGSASTIFFKEGFYSVSGVGLQYSGVYEIDRDTMCQVNISSKNKHIIQYNIYENDIGDYLIASFSNNKNSKYTSEIYTKRVKIK